VATIRGSLKGQGVQFAIMAVPSLAAANKVAMVPISGGAEGAVCMEHRIASHLIDALAANGEYRPSAR